MGHQGPVRSALFVGFESCAKSWRWDLQYTWNCRHRLRAASAGCSHLKLHAFITRRPHRFDIGLLCGRSLTRKLQRREHVMLDGFRAFQVFRLAFQVCLWPSAYKYYCLLQSSLAFIDPVSLKDCRATIPTLPAVLDLGIFHNSLISPTYRSIQLWNHGIDYAGKKRAYASPLCQQYTGLDLCRYCDGNPFVWTLTQQPPRQSHHLWGSHCMFLSIALLVYRPWQYLADVITIVRAYSCILPPFILYRRLWKSPIDFQPRLFISLDRGRGIHHRWFHALEQCAVGDRGGIQLHCIVCTANSLHARSAC